MPPQKKTKKKQDGTVAHLLHELVDVELLKHMSTLQLSPDENREVADLLEAWENNKYDRLPVPYPEKPGGRLVAGGHSTQRISGWIRRALTWRTNHDLDFQTCGPTILAHLLGTCGIECPELHALIAHLVPGPARDATLASWRESPEETEKMIKSKAAAVLHGSSKYKNVPELKALGEARHEWYKAFCRRYPEQFAEFRAEPENKKNTRCKFMAKYVTYAERQCLEALVEFLQREKWVVSMMQYDGVAPERKVRYLGPTIFRDHEPPSYEPFPQEVLDEAAWYVRSSTDVPLIVVEKKLTLKPEEDAKLHGPQNVRLVPADQRVQVLLSQTAQKFGLKRMGHFLMRRRSDFPMVWERAEKQGWPVHLQSDVDALFPDEWRGEAKAWIQAVMKPSRIRYVLKDVMTWFSENDTEDFPFCHGSMRYVGFRDGMFDLHWSDPNAMLVPYSDINCLRFYDLNFEDVKRDCIDANGLEARTPLWTKILDDQKMTPFMRKVFEVMLGRLHYAVGTHDSWQIMPHCIGDGGTGKSLVCELIIEQQVPDRVGILSGTHEATFGLQDLNQKEMFVAPDCPDNLHLRLNQQDFFCMCSGEPLSAAQKGRECWCGRWRPPGMLFGNKPLRYDDVKGAQRRRVLPFWFRFTPANPDGSLRRRIRETELAFLFVRSVLWYRQTAAALGESDFWQWAGEPFAVAREDLYEETDMLEQFLNQGDSTFQVRYLEGAKVPWQRLEDRFREFAIKRDPKAPRKLDEATLRRHRFPIHQGHYCKTCNQRALNQFCKCGKNRNRGKYKMVENMEMFQLEPRGSVFEWCPVVINLKTELPIPVEQLEAVDPGLDSSSHLARLNELLQPS